MSFKDPAYEDRKGFTQFNYNTSETGALLTEALVDNIQIYLG